MAITIDSFLRALGQQESTNNYSARNKSSGAYGKYQIMPQYWSAWAKDAGLGPNASKSPENQDRVARHRVQKLFDQYGNWADVASVWYSGRPYSQVNANRAQSSGPSIKNYVNSVISKANEGRGGLSLPVSSGRITQTYGRTNEPLDSGGFNKGLDIGVPTGTAVRAVTGGQVVRAGWGDDGWGVSVKVVDDEGNTHNYGHLSGVDVEVGDRVSPGNVIARSGNSGASTGPHLSYDVKSSYGQYMDPSRFLGFNAAGDNRTKENPIIGKDISEVGQVDTSLNFGESGGAPFNARDMTGQGYYSGATVPVDNEDDRFGEGGELQAYYDPSGDFNQDASAYWQLSNYFRGEVDKARREYDGLLMVNEEQGTVIAPDIDPDDPPPGVTVIQTGDGWVGIHQKATEALTLARGYEQNLDRLFAARQAGLIESGQDAAAAYLASEKEKAAEATRQYEDYVRRIGDLADIESIPQQRQQTLAATIQAINQANESSGRFGAGQVPSGGPEFTDVQPFANAIKETIPEQAPEPYNIDPEAMEVPETTGLQSRSPEDILGEFYNNWYGGNDQQQSSGGGQYDVNPSRFGSRETSGAPRSPAAPEGAVKRGQGSMSFSDFMQMLTGFNVDEMIDAGKSAGGAARSGVSGLADIMGGGPSGPRDWNPYSPRNRRGAVGTRPRFGSGR